MQKKTGYPEYFDWALNDVRLSGITATHNAYRMGSVAHASKGDEYSELIHRFNQQIAENDRVISTIYPACDGTLIAVKTS